MRNIDDQQFVETIAPNDLERKRMEKEAAKIYPGSSIQWSSKNNLPSIPLQEIDSINYQQGDFQIEDVKARLNKLSEMLKEQETSDLAKLENLYYEFNKKLDVALEKQEPQTKDIIGEPEYSNKQSIHKEIGWLIEITPDIFSDEIENIFEQNILSNYAQEEERGSLYYGQEVFENLLKTTKIEFSTGNNQTQDLDFKNFTELRLNKFLGAIPAIIRVLKFLKSKTFASYEFREMMQEKQMLHVFGDKELIRLIELSSEYDYELKLENVLDKASSKIFFLNRSENINQDQRKYVESIQEYISLAIDSQDNLAQIKQITRAINNAIILTRKLREKTDQEKLNKAKKYLEKAYKLIRNMHKVIKTRVKIQEAEKRNLMELLFTEALKNENGEIQKHRHTQVAIMAAKMGLMHELIDEIKHEASLKDKEPNLKRFIEHLALYLIKSNESKLFIENIKDFLDNSPDKKLSKNIALALMMNKHGEFVSENRGFFGLSPKELLEIAKKISPNPDTKYLKATDAEVFQKTGELATVVQNIDQFDLSTVDIAKMIYRANQSSDFYLLAELAKVHTQRLNQYLQDLKKSNIQEKSNDN
ncbi:hypothetical protein KKD70_02610 [Patescibacteria group bacterium]|nr:hypothetical protein [Patescibacteria group bacterium]